MAVRYSFLILLTIAAFFSGCSNDTSTHKTPQSDNALDSKPSVSAQEIQETPDEKALDNSLNKKEREDNALTGAEKTKSNLKATAPLPPAAPAKKSAPPAGPTGYISKDNAVLQSEPSRDAPKTAGFKIYQEVIILETKMTDETGKTFDVPQWYKVQTVSKKVGWVAAHSVSVN